MIIKKLFNVFIAILSYIKNRKNVIFLNERDILVPFNKLLDLFIKSQPLFDVQTIPAIKYLEKNWEIIKEEVLDILKEQDKIPLFHEVDDLKMKSNKRRVFVLKAYGNSVGKNCFKCPKTIEIINNIPGVYSAIVSILGGPEHVPKHADPFKGLLRYHLGLVIPKGKQSWMTIGGKNWYWEEGKGVLFDATYLHEVWNNSNEQRVILFLDIERPLSNLFLVKLNKWILKVLSKTAHTQGILQRA